MSPSPDPRPEFGERLGRLVPTAPDTRGWAGRAAATSRRRRQRRRVVGASLGAAAVLVAAVVTINQLGLGNGATQAGPAGTSSSSRDSSTTAPSRTPVALDPTTGCPADQSGYTDQSGHVDQQAVVTLPSGATSLRWCTWDGADQFMGEWAPPEPLTTDLDRWVTTYNALPTIKPDQACRADWSLPAAALLTYPDGKHQLVAGMRAGCATIGGRIGFEQMRTLTVDLLTQQRGPDFVPPKVAFTPCRYSSSTIPGEVARATSAAVCQVRQDGTRVSALVPADQVKALRDDLGSRLTRFQGAPMTDGPQLHLYQANGEMVVLTWATAESAWLWQEPTADFAWWVWRPTDPVRAVLDQTLTRMR